MEPRELFPSKIGSLAPVFEPLKDPEFFRQVRIDEFGAVCWPNGADLAPDALYDKIKSTARVA
jgi:Protein of unknown function (DUF2442)